MKNLFSSTLLVFVVLIPLNLQAQPTEQFVNVIVAPDRDNWTYKPAERVKFSISVLQNGRPVKNVKVKYEVGPEKMEPMKKDSTELATGTTTIEGVTLKTAGFLRCTVSAYVDGKEYRTIGTAGFDPQSIQPTIESPSDFVQFWERAKTEAAKIPIDAKMTLLPERCTEKVNVYHLNIQNFKVGARLYGILCVPKKEGKYPALLQVPGAGVRPYTGDIANAERGIITLQIGIHGIPVNMEPTVYTDLLNGALYQYFNFQLESRERYYYKRVYLGCVRANDFLVSLPHYDGTNLGVAGGSQGGALSIITAALDTRVKYLAAFYPALSDVTGYLSGRAGGWPHMFQKNKLLDATIKEELETIKYYDVVNFARILKAPGFYSWGYNDETCPPTSMYAAYNVINAPKELYLSLETGHWTYPEQREKFNDWIVGKLQGK